MGVVSRWSVNRPWQAVATWIVFLVVIFGGAALYPGSYDDSFSLPDTESTRAMEVMQSEFGGMSGNAEAQILFTPSSGTINQPAVEQSITELSAELMQNPAIAAVASPYGNPAAAQMGLISPNQEIGRLTLTFKMPENEVPVNDITALVQDVDAAKSPELQLGIAGQFIQFANTQAPSSEAIGIVVAIVIMLIMFGSVVAMGLPLLTALLGLGAGISLLTIAANWLSIASFGPTLAAMIGLGVGIDYSLFVINRYRQAVLAGVAPREAAIISVNTAGRAVVFAATTVVIALAGLFVLGMNFMNGLAIGAAITVISVMVTAVTLLPAVISLLGRRTFAWKLPWARNPKPPKPNHGFSRYAGGLQKRPWLFGAVALILMAVLSIPLFSMRSGFPDAGGQPAGSNARVAYGLTTEGFGAGANGPFLVVVEMPGPDSVAAANKLSEAIAATPGVASATPVVPGTPSVNQNGTAALILVTPTSGPQDQATSELLSTLRSSVIPQGLEGTGMVAYVGGSTATSEDFSNAITAKLPLFLAVVIGLGFLVLLVLFRSLLVPLTAALTSLLSFGAALGVTVFVFQWGNLASVFGITQTGPILPFIPVMLFAILFGLSMDYQVFLVSRMQEEWLHGQSARESIRRGLGGSGRVVAAAALIMFSVFIAFVFGEDTTIKMFGLSLATAIFLDAFVVRLVLVPSLMTLLDSSSWYLPSWLQRILPQIKVEDDAAFEAEEELVLGTPSEFSNSAPSKGQSQ